MITATTNWREARRMEALRLFRIVHGPGDAGSEHEFNFLMANEECGWMILAGETLRAKKAMLALESLTPNGSEFVGDVEACVAWIRAARMSQHAQILKLSKRLRDLEEKLNP